MQSSLPDPAWRRCLVVLGPPVLVLLLGAWQGQRGSADLASLEQQTTQLSMLAGEIDTMAAATPNRSVRFTGDPHVYPARLAAAMMHDGASVMRWEVLTAEIRNALAVTAVFGGLASLAAAAAGLAAACWAARRSRQSREAMEAAFSRIRVLLPICLGSLVGGLALACGAAVLFETLGWLFSTAGGRTEIRILAPGLVLTASVFWLGWLTVRQLRRSLAAFNPAPLPLLGREITPDDAPGLWRFLAERGAEHGTPLPEHVVAGVIDGFFVTSADILLAPTATILRGRTLHLPLPMLAMLNAGEIAAIISHELAHFVTDTGYGLRFLPIYNGIGRSLQALHAVRGTSTAWWTQGPAITLGTHMMVVFDSAVKHWSRLRELAVDRVSAAQSGREMAACALIRTALLQPLIEAVLQRAWRRPDDLPADMVTAIVAHAETAGLGDPAVALQDRQPNPTDSHPPLSQRLTALGLAITAPLLAAASRPVQRGTVAFAHSLFHDWPGLCAAVSLDAMALATTNRTESLARLREAAGQASEAVVEIFHDWRRPALFCAVLATVFLGISLLLAGTVMVADTNDPSQISTIELVSAGLAATGLLALLRVAQLWRCRTTPVLTLHPDGFLCRGLDRMVPWIGVKRLTVLRQRSSHVIIGLKQTTRLPKRISGWSTLVSARRSVVTMLGVRPRGQTIDELLELMHRYWNAASARAALAGEAEPAFSMILSEEQLQDLLSTGETTPGLPSDDEASA